MSEAELLVIKAWLRVGILTLIRQCQAARL